MRRFTYWHFQGMFQLHVYWHLLPLEWSFQSVWCPWWSDLTRVLEISVVSHDKSLEWVWLMLACYSSKLNKFPLKQTFLVNRSLMWSDSMKMLSFGSAKKSFMVNRSLMWSDSIKTLSLGTWMNVRSFLMEDCSVWRDLYYINSSWEEFHRNVFSAHHDRTHQIFEIWFFYFPPIGTDCLPSL